nr:hypothetical protein [Tanacetum cinerariifolium]
ESKIKDKARKIEQAEQHATTPNIELKEAKIKDKARKIEQAEQRATTPNIELKCFKVRVWIRFITIITDTIKLVDRCSDEINFWDISVLNDVCWGWKKILQCRDALRDDIVYSFGDGSTLSIWFDNWLSLRPLSQYISKRDIFEAGLSLNCKVCDLVDNNE